MATRTLYQKQADTRTKRALKLRAKADVKVRKNAAALVAALLEARAARQVLNRLNALYQKDISTETLLVHSLRTEDFDSTLGQYLAESTPGEELQLFNPTADSNGGAPLEPEALFGESVPTPIIAPPVSATV